MTTVLISAETVLLVLVLVLLAGVLRSHAELLRRLGSDGATTGVPGPPRASVPRGGPAPELAGVTPAGDPVHLAFAGAGGAMTLLAFLSTGCGTCAGFWSGLAGGELPRGVQAVAVVHDADRESPARLAELAPPRVPVVMSSAAWRDYAVPGAPYFVLVGDTVLGEGTATGWSGLSSLLGDALRDVGAAEGGASGTGRDIDATLAAAGVGPDHPSLYPAGPRAS